MFSFAIFFFASNLLCNRRFHSPRALSSNMNNLARRSPLPKTACPQEATTRRCPRVCSPSPKARTISTTRATSPPKRPKSTCKTSWTRLRLPLAWKKKRRKKRATEEARSACMLKEEHLRSRVKGILNKKREQTRNWRVGPHKIW